MTQDRSGVPIDPDVAGRVLRNYYETTPTWKIVDDLQRFSPELAKRLGVGADTPRPTPRRRGPAAWFAAFGRSLHRLFSHA